MQTVVLEYTYDEHDSTAFDEIAFEALLYDPLGGVHIQSGKNLAFTESACINVVFWRVLTSSKSRISAEE